MARLAAAEDEITDAEKVRIEREESAQRTLREQEEMMAAIVEESKKLQQEAEENTKVLSFLPCTYYSNYKICLSLSPMLLDL
jgi:hypothetical protein